MSDNGKRDDLLSRRSLLKYSGAAATTVGLAGCSGGSDDDGSSGSDGGTGGTSGSDGGSGGTSGSDGGSGGTEAEEVVVAQAAHNQTMDPQDFTGAPSRSVLFNAYEKLVTLDFLGDGSVIGQLATDWERVEDELVRLHIREGVTWHNGDTFTPEDAAFTVNRVADPDVDIATRRELLNVSHAEVVDGEHAIDVHLTAPDPIIIARMGFAGGTVNKSWIEENDQDFVSVNANGTGPYRMVEFSPEDETRFELVDPDEYWNDDVDITQYPERLRYIGAPESSTRLSQLLAGETHIISNVIPEDMGQIESESGVEVVTQATDRTMWVLMRYDVEPFSSLEFRQALNHAVDKETLVETVLSGIGEVTNQVTPPSWFGHNPELEENPLYPYDPERAEELIEQSGYAGEEITLTVPQGRYLLDAEVGTAIAGQIDSLSNLTCNEEIQDYSTFRDRIAPELENKPPMAFWGFGSAPPDASIKIDRNFTTGRLNTDFSAFSDPEIDEISERAASTTDAAEREQILQEANRLIMEKAACIPLYFQGSIYGVNTDVVEFQPIPQQEIYYFSMTMQ